MHLRVAGFSLFCVVLWHWCNGQNIPEYLQKDNIIPPNMFGQEHTTNKTIDQLIMEAMGGLKDALNVKSEHDGILMELDMLLSKQQYYSLYEQPNSNTLTRRKRKAIRNPIFRWPNGVIPYRFATRHFDQRDQYMVRQAMTEWERNTCLRFREATSSDINVVVFIDGPGCFSRLGMVGGVQEVSLSSSWCRRIGVYLHEIGHVIGLVHEHNRPDRDDYVEIILRNVETNRWDQFTKYTSQYVDQMNVPYDYYSVMHYGVTAFSRAEGWKTIIVKHPVIESRMGNPDSKQLSFSDIAVVNKMYKCHAKCDPSIQCSGGYVDKNCQCVCENGSHGCQIGGGTKPSGECKNLHSDGRSCDAWAKAGYCKTSQYVITKCAKSCGTCSDQVLSTSADARLANIIVKARNEEQPIKKVKEESHADDPNGGCRDEKDTCVTWARYGLCDNNIDEAVRLCPKTCNLCGHL